MNVPNWLEGFLRGVGAVLLVAFLGYISNATNISFIGNPFVITAITGLAAAWEQSIKSKSGAGLFGATRTS